MSALGIVLPGTTITPIVERVFEEHRSTKKGSDQLPVLKLGTGLIQSGEDIVAIKAGLLHFVKPNKFWIESRQKRYVPIANDLVIGVITTRLTDAYKVDLGSSNTAMLNFTGFEGTTKKNRPNLSIGDIVFARISVANKDMEPELVCFDVENRSDGFGEIKGGMMYTCSCNLSRRLQAFDNSTLELLGKNLAFEIVVGANGRFILNSNRPIDVIKIASIILGSEKNDIKWTTLKIKEIARSN